MKEKRQSKMEKLNIEKTQIGFREISHRSSSINKEEILSKYLRIADLSALKSYVKCKLSNMMRKMESLITQPTIASNGYL